MRQSPNQTKRPLRRCSRALAGIFLLGSWLICICRAVVFLADTHRVYAETNSINGWNDFAYGRQILFSDLMCAGIGLGALWLAERNQTGWIAWIPILASAASAIIVMARRPEEVIVFIVPLTVFYTLGLCFLSALLTSYILAYPKLKLALLR
jgi:hypothetical protein